MISTLDPSTVSLKTLILNAHKVLVDREKRQWNADLADSAKLRTYRLCKNDWGEESYLKVKLTRQQRSLFTQLRCGILPLHIETGRYGPKPLTPQERICNLCQNEPETEFHFLFKCDSYSQLRYELYSSIELIIPEFKELCDTDKFNIMMKDNDNVIKKCAIFIVNCYKKRTELLYNVHNDR